MNSFLIDLQESAISSHWEKGDKSILAILGNMQDRESWVLDENKDLLNAIVDWAGNLTGPQLEQAVEENPIAIIKILAFMKSKRSLVFIQKIEENFPGATSDLLLEALDKINTNEMDTRAERVLRDRLVALFRVDLLERIFSDERSEKIKQAIKNTTEKYGGIYA